jgi:hypothetical protein
MFLEHFLNPIGHKEFLKLDYDNVIIETFNCLLFVFDRTMVIKLPTKVDAQAPTIGGGMHNMDMDDGHV